MNVLDLFSGLGEWSRPWRERGHHVITLDFNPDFNADLVMDIRDFAKDPQRYLDAVAVKNGWIEPGEHWRVDVALISPDCRGFSVAALGHNWRLSKDAGYIAKTDTARLGVELVHAALHIVDVVKPRWWILENPRAILRKVASGPGAARLMAIYPRVTVTYCQYGMPYQKPTDLWGVFPPSWTPRPVCRPKAPCHESAPRGSRRGIQRIGSTEEFTASPRANPGKVGGQRHPMQVSPLVGNAWKDTMRSKENLPKHPAAVTNLQRGAGHPRPLQNSARAAALRAVIPYELALEFCVAAEASGARMRRSLGAWS